MSEEMGEKTEQPTQRKLDEAIKHGQIPRSAEVQTVFVLMAGLAALSFGGRELWQNLTTSTVLTLSHLHDTNLNVDSLQGYLAAGVWMIIKCVGPIVGATMLAGLTAGAIQSRFQTASEALTPDWNRINPVNGFQRVFSTRSLMPTTLAVIKFAFIFAITYNEIKSILSDPIFGTSVSTARLIEFLADACLRIIFRVGLGLVAIAAMDYGYQWWRSHRDLMMTREEVKDEMKNTEGNPKIKQMRRRRRAISKAKALAEVPKADVVVTNPTHFAIALRYNRKTMRAPTIVAKGIRLNALQIREIAQKHQVPIVENKPLARMLFKHGKVGKEIPSQFYAAVAEVLAWVYRVNRYRYYTELNQA